MPEESSETEDLVQAYLDENPSNLTPAQIKRITDLYDLTPEEVVNILKGMATARANLDPREINR